MKRQSHPCKTKEYKVNSQELLHSRSALSDEPKYLNKKNKTMKSKFFLLQLLSLVVIILMPFSALSQEGFIWDKNHTCQVYVAANASKRSFTYMGGVCKNNLLEGKATVKIFQDGSLYSTIIGEFQGGYYNGKAEVQYSDGEKFIGDFIKSKRIYGDFYIANGNVYTGPYDSEGMFSGKGVLKYSNGDRFEGEFKLGYPYFDKGTCYLANGNKFVGNKPISSSETDGTLIDKNGKSEQAVLTNHGIYVKIAPQPDYDGPDIDVEYYKYNSMYQFMQKITPRVVAMHKGTYIVVYGRNGFSGYNIDKAFRDKLDEFNEEDRKINDVQMVRNYSQFILADDGKTWAFKNRIVAPILQAAGGVKNRNAAIKLLTYHFDYSADNDIYRNARWILVSDKIEAEPYYILNDINKGISQYGNLNAAHITEDGYLLVFNNGQISSGNVPELLLKSLKEVTWKPTKVKFTPEGDWFIADDNGHYWYSISHD